MVKRATCHDCGTKEGQLHILGCDMERCPFCGNQLISCQCVYKKLRIDVSPGAWAYSHGLTDAQQKDWEKLLGDKGRIPFVLYPNLCAKCGTLWPEMFLVPDAEWKHYIEPQMQREMLCKACYKQVKAVSLRKAFQRIMGELTLEAKSSALAALASLKVPESQTRN